MEIMLKQYLSSFNSNENVDFVSSSKIMVKTLLSNKEYDLIIMNDDSLSLSFWDQYKIKCFIKGENLPQLIFCSTRYNYSDGIELAKKLNANGILPKPFNRGNLENLLGMAN